MKHILILEANLAQAVAIAKFIKRYKPAWKISGQIAPGLQRHNELFDEFIGPSDSITRDNYDIVIPTGGESTYALSEANSDLKLGNIHFEVNNLIVYDKKPTLKKVDEMGIPIPKGFENMEAIDTFPIFYKKSYERAFPILGIVRSKQELKSLAHHQRDLIFQEYIEGPSTFGVGFLAMNGKIITSFTHEEVLSYPRLGGGAAIVQKFEDPRLNKYTERIIEKLNYSGWGLVEYKYCEKRRDYVFMEVNAKFWASIELAFLNHPQFLQELLGINGKAESVPRVIFIDRLASLGIIEFIKNWKSLKNSYWINTRNGFFPLLACFLKEVLPKTWIKLLKSPKKQFKNMGEIKHSLQP